MPKVTVLMPVFNGDAYLEAAIRSILAQTLTDFEFLIINDGSTDRTAEILNSLIDPRVRVLHNSRNLKLIATLNRGLDAAAGDYVARMDCDDLSLPHRLARQVAFLDSHPRVGIVGAWMTPIGDLERLPWYSRRAITTPVEPARIRCELLFWCCLAHPTVMLRRRFFADRDLKYSPEFPHAEDYNLWARCSPLFDFANIPEVLLRYRLHPQSVSRIHQNVQLESARRTHEMLLRRLGIKPTPEELTTHQTLGNFSPPPSDALQRQAHDWLAKLAETNRKKRIYPEPTFSRCLGNRWLWVCLAIPGLSPQERIKRFLASSFVRSSLGSLFDRATRSPGELLFSLKMAMAHTLWKDK